MVAMVPATFTSFLQMHRHKWVTYLQRPSVLLDDSYQDWLLPWSQLRPVQKQVAQTLVIANVKVATSIYNVVSHPLLILKFIVVDKVWTLIIWF